MSTSTDIKRVLYSILLILIVSVSGYGAERLVLNHSDQFEVVKVKGRYVTYVVGNVEFETETGLIHCDSARWIRGENVVLNGNVHIDDEKYNISADSVLYDMAIGEMLALGQQVELWSYKDSIFASGTHAYLDENSQDFYMEQRPVMFINYPDTANMIEVIADRIDYASTTKDAQAYGDVKISSQEFSSTSNCAKMNTTGDVVDLFEDPIAYKGDSKISGKLISVYFTDNVLEYIDVIDSARGEFKEPVDTVKEYYDESILSGKRITLFFEDGLLNNVLCYGQAYSWYYPSARGKLEKQENSVSGDTIRFFVEEEQLQNVQVTGGAIGQYISEKRKVVDSVVQKTIDTIEYNGQFIDYAIHDSLITLKRQAHVTSGLVALDAHQIDFDTKNNLVEAFSADVQADTIVNPYYLSNEIQPNIIPVRLQDAQEEVFGDYLLYSIDTEKGRIIQSKTNYRTGYYYGERLVREQDEIYYVHSGRYTTCDATEPHFHFKSSDMKLMENNKLIAKPVIFYVERIPVFALPYYIFPLKKGRHSGILPFTFGQFERGERYVKNIGYYWAASEYWDWQGALDYYDQNNTINFRNRVNFAKRYALQGYLLGNYTRVTRYNSSAASEIKDTRWEIAGNYQHTVTPSFNISAYANFVSDPSYKLDYSQNIEERQNRSLTSRASFSKSFSNNISLSGNVSHNENLDTETRSDILPYLKLSLPSVYPFGSGSIDDNGRAVQKWYHKFIFRYTPDITNSSNRSTYTQYDTLFVDTSFVMDTLGNIIDTSYTAAIDSLSIRTRRHYAVWNHNPSLNLPTIMLGNYLNIIPSFSYSESWIKVFETDQSRDAGIDATTYRTYTYNAAVKANTKLYGTVYPNMFGLVGLRHVIQPSVTYSYRPEINRHAEVRSFTGAGVGSAKSQNLIFGLSQSFHAKVKKNEVESNYQLLTISSSFSYNLENETRPYSNLSTTFLSTALPIVNNLSANMVHSFYAPGTDILDFWSPYLLSFRLNTSLNLAGGSFLFDDASDKQIQQGADSVSQLHPGVPAGGRNGKGWSLVANYSYQESGRGASWSKDSFIYFTLRFYLTPSTQITYTQRYDIDRKITTSNSVNIIRKIHCWTGSIYWVPTGSNRGFGFKLYVTDMPEIKLDNNYDSFTDKFQ